MSAAIALNPGLQTRWTIVSGGMKGAVRVMEQSQFIIGRNPECEFIILNDPKCSRRQAGIRVTSRGCEITSLNDKNPCLVNGREVHHALLHDGDIVTLGETEVQFSSGINHRDAAHGALTTVQSPDHPAHVHAHADGHVPAPRIKRRSKRAKPQGNSKRFLIYGVAGLLLYLIFSDSPKKKEAVAIRTEQHLGAEIELANKSKAAAEAENAPRLNSSIPARQAQEYYVRGFRDYRKGQFERALVSFQACLALNREHPLCARYLRLSQRKFNEMIQYYVLLGRKYRDQNQFQSCRAAFRNVMVMIKDANNETYKMAKANYEACNAFIEGRF